MLRILRHPYISYQVWSRHFRNAEPEVIQHAPPFGGRSLVLLGLDLSVAKAQILMLEAQRAQKAIW